MLSIPKPILPLFRPAAHQTMAKYDALEAYLRSLPGDTVRLTFADLSTMLPKGLPASAYEHSPFWSNTDSHVHAVAWQRAGWRTVGHNLKLQYVDFRRFGSVSAEVPEAYPAGADEATAPATGHDMTVDRTADGCEDGENRQLVGIKTRRGQPAFRDRLLRAYGSTCAVTGSTVEPLLEAAHIVPHALETNYATSNGIVLRADIHTLFDLHMIAVDAGGRVAIARLLEGTEYAQYRGRRLVALPSAPGDQPSPDQLKWHHDLFLAREDVQDA